MDRNAIEEAVRKVIADTLDLDPADCGIAAALNTDVLGMTQIAMQLEFIFGIEIDEASFVSVKTVKEVVDLIASILEG
jgi:acyl carrier protein